jgi:hypothetical protein
MLSLLLSSASSVWWDFNETQFHLYKHGTFERPIFAVCYSESCAGCIGLPEMARHFAETLGGGPDLLVTAVSTSHPGIGIFRITGTPFMCLVLGPKRKYWPSITEKDEEQWHAFIQSYTSPFMRAISDPSSLQTAVDHSLNGGTSFHLATPTEGSELFQELKALSQFYRIFGCSFTFEINTALVDDVLTAYRSPNCSRLFNCTNVTEFVSQNKFSSLHKYDLEEYQEMLAAHETFMFLVVRQLDDDQKSVLLDIDTAIGCSTMVTGWASTSESKRKLLAVHSLNFSDLPALVYTNPVSRCAAFYKGSADLVIASGFAREARSGALCNRTFYAVGDDSDGEGEAAIGPLDGGGGIRGLVFIAVYAGIGLAIIAMTRRYGGRPSAEKNLHE